METVISNTKALTHTGDAQGSTRFAHYMQLLDYNCHSSYQQFLNLALSHTQQQAKSYMHMADKGYPFLERTRKLLEMMEYRDDWFQEVVLIGGTAGKGSVTSYMQQILHANHYRVGAFYSPAVLSECETIQTSPQQTITPDELLKTYSELLQLLQKNSMQASHFELMLGSALLYCKKMLCTHLLLEVGCGGARDATNAVVHRTAIITNIGSDHMPLLGKNKLELAQEKLGIIPTHGRFISAINDQDLAPVISQLCQQKKTEWVSLPKTMSDYQTSNRELALLAAKQVFNIHYHADELMELLPGRMDIIQLAQAAPIFIDGAHSFDKCAALVDKLKRQGLSAATILLAVKADKDLLRMVQALDPIANEYYATFVASELNGETLTVAALTHQLRRLTSKPVHSAPDLPATLSDLIQKTKQGKALLVTGSFLVVQPSLLKYMSNC